MQCKTRVLARSAALDRPDDDVPVPINESERLGNRLAGVAPIPRR